MRQLIVASVIFTLSTLSFADSEEVMRKKDQIDDKFRQMDCVKFKAKLPSLAKINLGEIKFTKPGSENYELAIYTIDLAFKKASECMK